MPSCAAHGIEPQADTLGQHNESYGRQANQGADEQRQDEEDLFFAFVEKNVPLARREISANLYGSVLRLLSFHWQLSVRR